MALQIGQILRGATGTYKLLHLLKGTTVFKAKVLSSPSTRAQAKWCGFPITPILLESKLTTDAYWLRRPMVKTAATAPENMCLRREYRNYRIKNIASSPYIRALCDTVQGDGYNDEGPSCLVFEWIDHDLQADTTPEFRSNLALPRAVFTSVLSMLSVLKKLNAVHTGWSLYSLHIRNTQMINCQSEKNIFVSHIDGNASVAKLEDLGNIKHFSKRPQPINNQTYKDEFELAEQLEAIDHPLAHQQTPVASGAAGIPDPPASQDLLDFIGTLLVIDPDSRPSASDILLHFYL
ncbi:hypothetical protein EJ02DRAFT_499956 [Clathrospora elynae]|uniref:Protein kinase domain-containing protein n=1 Tax=Clathrospora elynae TaxID=706981 RepID=A0A6A5T0A7_9PLEO|nr:hypothetical protein EJ02DRAFT_499956 [Clathrospora elynae]